MGEVWPVDTIFSNFLTELDFIDVSLGLGEMIIQIQLKTTQILVILNGFSEGLSLFEQLFFLNIKK